MSAKKLREHLLEMRHHIGSNPAAHRCLDDALLVLAKMHPAKYEVNGRPITFGDWFEGHGPDDPSGRYYTYDDEPGVTHWMSVRSIPIRCKEIEQ